MKIENHQLGHNFISFVWLGIQPLTSSHDINTFARRKRKVMKINKISKQVNFQSIKEAVLNRNFILSQISL